MFGMIVFALLVVYSFSLAYLVVCVNKTVWKCSYCADSELSTASLWPSWVPLMFLTPMPLHFFALTFWGFTENPYRGREGPRIRPGDDLAMLVILLIGFCFASLGWVLFQSGRLSAIVERRRAAIDEIMRQQDRDEFIRRYRGEP